MRTGDDRRVRIRLAAAGDAAPARSIYGAVIESSATSFELVVPSLDEMAVRIVERQPAHPWLVAEVAAAKGESDGDGDGRAIAGYAYAGRFSGRPAYDWSVETSIYLAESARGRGIGRALYQALLAVLVAQGYRQAMAGIALPNPASVRLHESVGFAPVGVYRAVGWKLGAWHDVGWWQRGLASSAIGAPQAPVPLTALPTDVLEAALAWRGPSPAGDVQAGR